MYFQRLRDLREDADLSQKQVAALLGIQQTVYSRYERGFQTIPLEHLPTIFWDAPRTLASTHDKNQHDSKIVLVFFRYSVRSKAAQMASVVSQNQGAKSHCWDSSPSALARRKNAFRSS